MIIGAIIITTGLSSMNNNQKSDNRLPLILGAIAVIGFPTVFGFVWTQTGNIWQALGLMVVYGLIVAVVGVFTGVWQKIQPKIVDDISNDILARMSKWGQGRFRHAYLQHLIYSHRTFDVKGLTTQSTFALELEKVFVDLNISPEASPNSALVPEKLQEGGHSIWTWLNAPEITHMAILGAPGSGKTTLLKFVTLTLANRNRKSAKEIPDRLPILLFLRDYAQKIMEKPDTRLSELIEDSLKLMDEKPPDGWFQARLKEGNCLVMLDGLDEVADFDIRLKVVNWVEKQIQVPSQNWFIITSRPHGYRSNPISGVNQLEVRPFNRHQIRLFVYNWYLANEIMSHQKFDPGVEMEARKGADALMQKIDGSFDIAELAVNPLLLTMIANVHRFRGSLPGRRVALYAEMCEVFLGKRQEAKGMKDEFTPAQKQSVLRHLAYATMQQRTREFKQEGAIEIIAEPLKLVPVAITGKAFLELIRDGSGILIERESGEYSFSHKTFQEFLAAIHIQEEKLQDELIGQISDSWWYETIRLFCARTDATPIVAACLVVQPTPIETLVLAIECAEEALNIQPAVKQELDQIIDQNIESEMSEARRVTALILLKRRLRQLVRLDDNTFTDIGPITNAEFQLFLNTHPEYAPDHWEAPQFPSGAGKMAIVGVTASAAQAFCEWLGLGETEPGWFFRLPRPAEIHEQGPYWIGEDDRAWLAAGQPIQQNLRQWLLPEDQDHLRATSDRLLSLKIELVAYHPELSWYHFALAHDLDLALNHALDLDLDYALNRAHELDPGFTLNLSHALNHDRARDLDLVRDIAHDLDIALNRARDLDLALNRARTHALDLARARDLNFALANARDLNRALANVSNQNALISLFSDIAHILMKSIELAVIIAGIKNSRMIISVLNDANTLMDFRLSLLKSASDWLKAEPRQRLGTHPEWEIWNQTVDIYLKAYATLAMLERRRRGEWEAFEQVWIVKQRGEQPATASKKDQ